MQKSTILVAIAVVVVAALFFFGYKAINTSVQPSSTIEEKQDAQVNKPAATNVSEVKTFDVEGKPFEFSLKEIRVKKGDSVRVNFTNKQGMHDWVVDEFSAKTKQIQAGQTESVEFVADKTGSFEYYCSVGNHRQMGMVGNLIVED